MRVPERMRWVAATAALVLAAGCAPPPTEDAADDAASIEATVRSEMEAALDRGLERIEARADSIDEIFRPLPLLTAAQENELRRFLQAQHLARARRLGVPRPDSAEIDSLVASGRLVRLDAETEHWVLGRLDSSAGVVTPDTEALLVEIAERFQDRLAEMGVPPYRLELTSILRTAEDQARLRRTNPNAASGVSTHEFATTVDIAYFNYPAPEAPDAGATMAPGWLEPRLDRVARLAAERVSARRSRELKAILGGVLIDMQREGKVLVTLERRQPVFHITVARRY